MVRESYSRKTPTEVAAAVRADFRAQNLTMKEAAALVGVTPAALSALLSRGTYMGRAAAARLHEKFGYDIPFLLTGAGTLRASDAGGTAPGSPAAADIQLRQILSICVGLSAAVADLQRRLADLSAKVAGS